jgi:hypothetical protein
MVGLRGLRLGVDTTRTGPFKAGQSYRGPVYQ